MKLTEIINYIKSLHRNPLEWILWEAYYENELLEDKLRLLDSNEKSNKALSLYELPEIKADVVVLYMFDETQDAFVVKRLK